MPNTDYEFDELQILDGTLSATDIKEDSVIAGVYIFEMPASNVSIKAIFKAIGYAVYYDTNGATSGDIPKLFPVFWNTSNLLPSTTLVKSGYTFLGYRVSENGSSENVASGNTYGDLANNNTDTHITLQAKWEEKDGYSVRYDMNGSSTVIPNKLNVKWTDDELLPNITPLRFGCIFAGWTVNISGNQVYVQNYMQYGELAASDKILYITLQAQWE